MESNKIDWISMDIPKEIQAIIDVQNQPIDFSSSAIPKEYFEGYKNNSEVVSVVDKIVERVVTCH